MSKAVTPGAWLQAWFQNKLAEKSYSLSIQLLQPQMDFPRIHRVVAKKVKSNFFNYTNMGGTN